LRYASKVDSNQKEIVAALRKKGAVVLITSQLKNCFDVLVCHNSNVYLVEIKDGSLAPSARKLTKGEQQFKEKVESVGVKYHVITSVSEAILMIEQK